MSYGIVRVQKFTAGSVKGIEVHDRREKEHSHSNPDIDFSKVGENYDLHSAQNDNFRHAVNERISQLNLKKAVRKDAIVMAQVLVTSDGAFFDGLKMSAYARASHSAYAAGDPFCESEIQKHLGEDSSKYFFRAAYDFLADRYGRENIISATVHMDERTPHMHFNFVPVTADGRLSAKSVLTRQSLIEQQTDFYEQVGKQYGLERGESKESGKRRRHLETAEYKDTMKAVEEVRSQGVEAAIELQELRGYIETLKTEESSLQGKIEGLQAQYSAIVEEQDEMKAELDIVREAVKKETASAQGAVGMERMKERIAEARIEADKRNRQTLLERFIALPHIAPLFERFMQSVRGRNISDKKKDELTR